MWNITQSNSGPRVTLLVLRKYSAYRNPLALSVGSETVKKGVLLQTHICQIPYLTSFNFY